MPNDWQSVPELPPLGSGEVQIWRVDLNDAGDNPDLYAQNLSNAELERAGRYRAGQVRLQFVVARASLRVLLGNLLGVPANGIAINLSAYGKPEIAPANGDPIFFNVAHSRETVLIALCRTSPVGIDLEYLERQTHALDIARNSFHTNEIAQIEQVADSTERRSAFFRCWTRKEAVVKADGRGLSLSLASFQVPVLDQAESAPVLIEDCEGPARQTWFVSDIALGEGIAGAFAAEVPGMVPRTFRFPLKLLPQTGTKA